jgi:hypothetical protein
MNIFVTHYDPALAVQHLDNSRVNKMIIETAQLLSTVNSLTGDSYVPYKPTHRTHPCTIWAARSAANYNWLVDYFYALAHEYTHVRSNGKIHASTRLTFSRRRSDSDEQPTCWASVVPDALVRYDVHTAYQSVLAWKYAYEERIGRSPKFTGRVKPDFALLEKEAFEVWAKKKETERGR